MRKTCIFTAIVTFFLFSWIIAFSQENPTDKATVPFSNPSKPGKIEASVHNGSIIVKGYEGKEVVVEARAREKKLSEENAGMAERVAREVERAMRAVPAAPAAPAIPEEKKKTSEKAAGMHLIDTKTTGLTVEEDNNLMEISVESFKRAVDLTIQVPYSTSLELNTFNNGDIVVENVNGEIEVNNHNGALKLSGVSGVVVANTFNGDVTVNFAKVAPDKAMSFSTWNGDIDVTFPADIKANVKMKSERGDIYSDYEIKITATPASAVENKRKEGGKYRISFGEYIYGTINGGGPEFQFNTFNGNIFIRKAK